jgi:hypothetical protein
MKQISARAFRVAFPRLTEPVTVSTRGEAGEIRILGTWTPAIPYRDTWADVPGQTARTFTPVPKPRRKG